MNITSVFKRNFLNRDAKREWNFFLHWLNEHSNSGECILVAKNESLYELFFNTSLKIGDIPKIKKIKGWSGEQKQPDFVLLAKGEEGIIPFVLDKHWHCTAGGFFFTLYENINRFKNLPVPIRFGLSDKEKKFMVERARLVLEKFLKNGELPAQEIFLDLPFYFRIRTDLCVALWTGGKLRGSVIVQNLMLWEGLIKAVVDASRDPRFKPISYYELENTRIEIALISDFHLALPKIFIKQNKILPHKGYRLILGEKSGWFLPEVFNVRNFQNLNEFLDDLSQEEAGLAPTAWRNSRAKIEIFDVEDFIENKEHIGINNLFGPIIMPASGIEKLKERAQRAGDWLANIQEPDGNFPPIINPLTGRASQIDWPRSAFSAWALAELVLTFGQKGKKYQKAAEKHFQFINSYIWEPGFRVQFLTLAYVGQESLALFKILGTGQYYLAAVKIAERILAAGEQILFESITFQQIASFLAEMAVFERRFLEPAQRFANIARANFENNLAKKNSQNLAFQAELVNVFDKLFKLTQDNDYKEFSRRVADWLVSFQFLQGPKGIFGPFAGATDSDSVYTRATGKIFEALANLVEYRESAQKALAWLLAMQYTKENIFFVPTEFRSKIIGGFRHDYFNQAAWIDAAGHFLLGAVRLMNNK